MKKFWLSFLSLIAILFIWTTFANPIAPETHFVCSMFENVEIDNYRVIVSTKSPQKEYPSMDKNPSKDKSVYNPILDNSISSSDLLRNHRGVWRFYLPNTNECVQEFQNSAGRSSNWELIVALLDNSIDVDALTEEEFNDNAIYVWTIWASNCLHDYDCDVINTYKIINSWYNYTIVLDKRENIERKHDIKDKTSKFPLFWWLAILIETLVLLIIAKIFRKEDEISNKKLLLRWVVPTTVTLPLLWFVLPLIIKDGTRYIIIWETLVTIIESVMIKYWLNISRKRSVIACIISNLLSFLFLSFGEFFDWDLYSIVSRILLLAFVFIEWATLFLAWKLSKELISGERLFLCCIVVPIVEIALSIFIVRLFWLFEIYVTDFSLIITMIAVKLLVDVIIIKLFRKIWRWKVVYATIFFNLCIIAIILALAYFSD